MSLLATIDSPEQLRTLSEDQLVPLAAELREFLLETLNVTGGHLGAGLGTIELTIALHYVFNTPDDRLVWDVGHQAYPHKILTGRRDLIRTIRKKDGLAPFPARDESPYDAFGAGHSSTSIGAALGMSWASAFTKQDRRSVAIIGDGGMTAGMAFEALNHAGAIEADLLVILNDNAMSISNNVGALSNYFARILSSKLYASMRSGSKKILGRVPPVWEFARRTESHLKGMVAPGTLFEELGFNYIGPVDGHDMPGLVKTLRNVQELKGPQFLHLITKKGRGYSPAEANPISYHAVSPAFYKPSVPDDNVKPAAPKPAPLPSYSQIFGDWLCDTAVADPRMVAITPAMREGSGMVRFAKEHPDRYIDVAIAEQHAVTFAAGLACEKGLRPVVAIYSSFLQRAYDQLLHDVALQQLPVVFALDRAGLVGDGPTHSGVFDLSFLRCIPNLVIMTPSDEQECRDMLTTGMHCAGPSVIRYPRGVGRGRATQTALNALPLGKAKILRQGKGVALLVFGSLMAAAEEVAEQIDATVVNMRFVKPLDAQMILSLLGTHHLLVTLEENVIMGGAGSAVNELIMSEACNISVLNLGLPDYFIPHGSPSDALAHCGLDAHGILGQIEVRLRKLANNNVSTTETAN